MQQIGHNVQSPSISMHLENILRNNWRLPAPQNCPPKVCLLYALKNLMKYVVWRNFYPIYNQKEFYCFFPLQAESILH